MLRQTIRVLRAVDESKQSIRRVNASRQRY